MTVIVLWLFLAVLWVGLQCAFVVFPDQTHFFFFVAITQSSPSLGCSYLGKYNTRIYNECEGRIKPL